MTNSENDNLLKSVMRLLLSIEETFENDSDYTKMAIESMPTDNSILEHIKDDDNYSANLHNFYQQYVQVKKLFLLMIKLEFSSKIINYKGIKNRPKWDNDSDLPF